MGAVWSSLAEVLLGFIEWMVEVFFAFFNASLNIIVTEVGMTPLDFSPAIVNTLQTISNSTILPLAGILLTYIFCYEMINMLTEKNNMAEVELQNIFWLVGRTAIAIILITNCFTITLAFFDVAQHLVNQAATHVAPGGGIPANMADDVFIAFYNAVYCTTDSIYQIGIAIGLAVIMVIALLMGLVMVGLIYLVVWSRIVMILLYVSVAALPFATLMAKDWLGHIGQNFLKNLMALTLQGFLMVIVMIIYAGIVMSAADFLADGPILGMILILVCMGVCVKALMSCLSLAKSIFGAQ